MGGEGCLGGGWRGGGGGGRGGREGVGEREELPKPAHQSTSMSVTLLHQPNIDTIHQSAAFNYHSDVQLLHSSEMKRPLYGCAPIR